MQVPHDFPSVPKCFSHLIYVPSMNSSNDEDQQSWLSQSLPSGTSLDIHKTYARSLSLSDSQSSASNSFDFNSKFRTAFYQEVFSPEDEECKRNRSLSQDSIENKASCSFGHHSNGIQRQRPILTKQSPIDELSDSVCQPDLSNPYVKLNTSLEKLQREMKELRLFDFSLFCQLLSLHESIQDLKTNAGDRYSETGSEYSLGSASYMGSMSSLDEESDWGESQVFMHSFRGEESAADDDETKQSTSSLIEKISALTQRAEEDV